MMNFLEQYGWYVVAAFVAVGGVILLLVVITGGKRGDSEFDHLADVVTASIPVRPIDFRKVMQWCETNDYVQSYFETHQCVSAEKKREVILKCLFLGQYIACEYTISNPAEIRWTRIPLEGSDLQKMTTMTTYLNADRENFGTSTEMLFRFSNSNSKHWM